MAADGSNKVKDPDQDTNEYWEDLMGWMEDEGGVKKKKRVIT